MTGGSKIQEHTGDIGADEHKCIQKQIEANIRLASGGEKSITAG